MQDDTVVVNRDPEPLKSWIFETASCKAFLYSRK